MQVNMLEAKSQLSSLIVAAEHGEEVLIARNGVPVARLLAYRAPRIKAPGAWRGLVPYTADWRSDDTEQQVEQLFLGEDQSAGDRSSGGDAGKPDAPPA
jgi:prevent-host-death family protein